MVPVPKAKAALALTVNVPGEFIVLLDTNVTPAALSMITLPVIIEGKLFAVCAIVPLKI